MAKCDGPNCEADIIWAQTPEGKAQPFDREPNEYGNRVLLGRGSSKPPLALPPTALAGAEVPDECLYTPHHAVCPDVKRFRATTEEKT